MCLVEIVFSFLLLNMFSMKLSLITISEKVITLNDISFLDDVQLCVLSLDDGVGRHVPHESADEMVSASRFQEP